MPRKNNRNSKDYRQKLGFSPAKYLSNPATLGRLYEGQWTETSQPFRGDIWFAYLGRHQGAYVIEGCRPVLVISNNEANYRGETITVVPITTNTSRLYLPTQMEMFPEDVARVTEGNELAHSALLIDQITTIDKVSLRGYVGRVKAEKLKRIDQAVLTQLGMAENMPDSAAL